LIRKLFYEAMNILQGQFILVFIHASQLLFIDCNFPKGFTWFIVLHAVMFYSLFADFYKQAYKNKQSSKVRTVILYYKLLLLGCLCFCFTVLLHKQLYTPFPVTVFTSHWSVVQKTVIRAFKMGWNYSLFM
jgi:hypothetical protein